MKSSSHWDELRRDLIKATAKAGARSALAKSLGVTRSAVSQWLSRGGTTPTAETALRLFEWVHPGEDKKEGPGRVSPRPEPKTQVANQVMTKRNQVRRNSSSRTAAPQSKTQHRGQVAAGPVTCVWIGPDGSECARVDFPPEVYSLIKRAATKLGITIQQFFDNAIRDFIKSHDGRRDA